MSCVILFNPEPKKKFMKDTMRSIYKFLMSVDLSITSMLEFLTLIVLL